MNKIIIIAIVFFLIILYTIYFRKDILNKLIYRKPEGYTNYTLGDAMGDVPRSQTDVLVQDTYPITGINGISNDNSSDIWWHYPTFKLGSFAQITNNLKYPNNPDEGTCMPASMCGALYKEKHLGTNYITPLPQINPTCGTRVGYFSTNVNLLPFRTNEQNILY